MPAALAPLLCPSAPQNIRVCTPPAPALQVSIVVPVRDEEDMLPLALAALARQTDTHGCPLSARSYEVLVLANNCRDRTAAAARAFGRSHPHFVLHVLEATLPPAHANIGVARRLLMDEACRRLLSLGRPGAVVASTDGDVQVAPDWISQTVRAFAQGADAVGGAVRTLIPRTGDPDARRYAQRDRVYQHGLCRLAALLDPDPADPWPRHHQFFGGSMAVSAGAYVAAGGLPPVRCLEDVALEQALLRRDARVRHCPRVRARASARQAGRVDMGLAAQLREWGEMGRAGAPHSVQQPEAVAVRLHAHAALRQWHQEAAAGCPPSPAQVDALAETLLVPCGVLCAGLADPAVPFGEMWEAVMARHNEPHGTWARRWPLWDIRRALPDLHARLAALREQRSAGSHAECMTL